MTPLAADLKVTEGMAGQGIAISGAFAVLTSLSISTLTQKINRKTLLLALTALMCLSGIIVGLAPNYPTYMAGRAPIGIVVGLFFMGKFALFTYLRPFLETVTRVGASTLSFILLAIGSAWSLLATGAPVGWWMWVARTLPADAQAGGGLMVAVVQLCIALGSTVGGVLFDSSGYRSTFVFSAGVLLAGAFLVFLTARADGKVST